jgi:2-(1,2-epoxy-1,2-dihydrophenyl)acetyl-CoA isomerase
MTAFPARFGDVGVSLGEAYVGTVTIDRPPNNFFDAALIAGIGDAVEALAAAGCRAVVLRSEGKHFCAGASLGGGEESQAESEAGRRLLYEQAARLFGGPLPIVAAVRGAAIGGGLGLALAADFRVGSPETRMAANFAQLGFHHGFALTVTLPMVVGSQRANEVLYTGRRLDGTESHRIGMLDRLVAVEEIEPEAYRFAAELASSAPLSVQRIRATMRAGLAERCREIMVWESAEQEVLLGTADFAEGVAATAQRRVANFQGR